MSNCSTHFYLPSNPGKTNQGIVLAPLQLLTHKASAKVNGHCSQGASKIVDGHSKKSSNK